MALGLEEIGVGLLADLAFECLPVEAHEVLGLLPLQLGGKPVLEALEVDETDTS